VKENSAIPILTRDIAEFCRKWQISELSLFGSALRPDFRPDSDLDILVSFSPEADWSLLDHIRMAEDLGELFGRRVDLVSRRAVERSQNWMRRKSILESAEVIYAA
jgi:predicted nucleotidyltransferase